MMGILTDPHSHHTDNYECHSMYFCYLIWKIALSLPLAKKCPCFTIPDNPKSLHTSTTRFCVDDSGAAERRVSHNLTRITELIK